jgi:hypothetical protein
MIKLTRHVLRQGIQRREMNGINTWKCFTEKKGCEAVNELYVLPQKDLLNKITKLQVQ